MPYRLAFNFLTKIKQLELINLFTAVFVVGAKELKLLVNNEIINHCVFFSIWRDREVEFCLALTVVLLVYIGSFYSSKLCFIRWTINYLFSLMWIWIGILHLWSGEVTILSILSFFFGLLLLHENMIDICIAYKRYSLKTRRYNPNGVSSFSKYSK